MKSTGRDTCDTAVSGALFLAFGQACAELRLFADATTREFLASIAPDDFYPLPRFDALLQLVRERYDESAPILEQVGFEMMQGWYAHVGHTLVASSVEFLRYQTGSQGYHSVIRGPRERVGEFALTALDEAGGTATITSTTPLSREMECGVLRGGMTVAGKLAYLGVARDGDVFTVRFAETAEPELVSRGLEEQLARRERYWAATQRTIVRALDRMQGAAGNHSDSDHPIRGSTHRLHAGATSSAADGVTLDLQATVSDEPPFAAVVDSLPGRVIEGRYRIHERIGSGAHSVVHRARHLFLERDVALKLLRVPGKLSVRTLARFRKEGAAACRLQHPSAVTVLDSGVFGDGLPYLAMELLEGIDVATISDHPVPANVAIAVARAVAELLAVAAERGLIHRDIKPANVFLHLPGRIAGRGDARSRVGPMALAVDVKVLDFGLAKMLDDSDPLGSDMTHQGAIVGTPAYLAPERLGGGMALGPEVDVF
ncbi:MAG: serine/threonine-protein kinase, partial [Polyangiaceae bacterium]